MIIKEEQLRCFARYEIAYDELCPNEEEYVFEEYSITLDDLKRVLKKIDEEKIGSFRFCREWLGAVLYKGRISNALSLPYDNDEDVVDTSGIHSYFHPRDPLPYNEKDVIIYAMDLFNPSFDDYCDGDEEAFERDLSCIREVISCYESNKDRPFLERDYPDEIKRRYVIYIDTCEGTGEPIDPNEAALYRRFIEELIEKGDIRALESKGYMHYGGSSVYPCDWNISRDCLEKAFEASQDPFAANSLGYIYYYGRVNNGVPEYDKAFQYYTYGYVHKLYESTYKLADMYKGGKGVIKSEETYRMMIEELYDTALEDFCRRDCPSFADIALRMGGIYEEYYHDIFAARKYYLQADYAIRNREYYGDDVVQKHIAEGLERTGKVSKGKKKTMKVRTSDLLHDVLGEDYTCILEIKKLKNRTRFTFTRDSFDKEFLITFSGYDYCEIMDRIVLYSDGKEKYTEGTFVFDCLSEIWLADEKEVFLPLEMDGETVVNIPEFLIFEGR